MQARVAECEDAMAKTGNTMLETCYFAEAESVWPCRRLAAANATPADQVDNLEAIPESCLFAIMSVFLPIRLVL